MLLCVRVWFVCLFVFSYKFFKCAFSIPSPPPLKVSWENCCTRMTRPDILITTESGLSIMSPGLHHEIWIPFIPPDDMSVERVLISIERVLQSDKKWLFAGAMRVTFVHAALPVGKGRLGISTLQLSSSWVEMLGRKKIDYSNT